jgi:hypothetical protein
MDGSRDRLGDWLWLLAFGVASSVWCLSAAQTLGVTFDEPLYLAGGLEFWRTGSHHTLLRYGSMPLPMDVCALPVYVGERLELGSSTGPAAFFVARSGTLLFWWLLLFYAGQAGRALAGPWAGRLAVAFIAVEPLFLAHACLATTDIAVSACLLVFAYHFRLGREGGWWKRVGVPAAWFGIALLAKASALAFAPLCMVVVEAERLATARTPRSEWLVRFRSWAWDGVQIGVIGMAVVLVYCGTDGRPNASFVAWAEGLPEGSAARGLVWIARHLCIFSNAGTALLRQILHNRDGHGGAFLLGATSPDPVWYYFPAALGMKLTVGLLVLLMLLAVFRPRSLMNWAMVATGVLLVYSLECHVQIGVRLMLPLVALGAVGLAAALTQACQKSEPGWQRKLWPIAALASIGWATFSALHVWPYALCYTNELGGGTDRGYLCLSDSNYDWGQGLPELEAWRERQGNDAPLTVWYFGTDPLLANLPIHELPLHTRAASLDQARRMMAGQYLAVSTTLLYGSYGTSEAFDRIVDFLHHCRPIARTQTFLIYDFRDAQDE